MTSTWTPCNLEEQNPSLGEMRCSSFLFITGAFRQVTKLSRSSGCLECTKQVLAGSAWGSAGSSGCSPTSPRRSCRPHSVLCSARNPPAAAAAPGLRAGCSRASSVTLRVAPQAAAPAISAKRWPGAPPRGFLSARVARRRLQDVQEKGLCLCLQWLV